MDMREAHIRRARLSALLAAQAGAAAPGSGALSIANCKAYAVREPVSGREYAILKIETAGGIAGWGETRSIAAADLARAAAILRGRQATEYVPLHAQLAACRTFRPRPTWRCWTLWARRRKAPGLPGAGRTHAPQSSRLARSGGRRRCGSARRA